MTDGWWVIRTWEPFSVHHKDEFSPTVIILWLFCDSSVIILWLILVIILRIFWLILVILLMVKAYGHSKRLYQGWRLVGCTSRADEARFAVCELFNLVQFLSEVVKEEAHRSLFESKRIHFFSDLILDTSLTSGCMDQHEEEREESCQEENEDTIEDINKGVTKDEDPSHSHCWMIRLELIHSWFVHGQVDETRNPDSDGKQSEQQLTRWTQAATKWEHSELVFYSELVPYSSE